MATAAHYINIGAGWIGQVSRLEHCILKSGEGCKPSWAMDAQARSPPSERALPVSLKATASQSNPESLSDGALTISADSTSSVRR